VDYDGKLSRNCDSGVPCCAMNYHHRLAKANLAPWASSLGERCGNAFAETINGLYKTEFSSRLW